MNIYACTTLIFFTSTYIRLVNNIKKVLTCSNIFTLFAYMYSVRGYHKFMVNSLYLYKIFEFYYQSSSSKYLLHSWQYKKKIEFKILDTQKGHQSRIPQRTSPRSHSINSANFKLIFPETNNRKFRSFLALAKVLTLYDL